MDVSAVCNVYQNTTVQKWFKLIQETFKKFSYKILLKYVVLEDMLYGNYSIYSIDV